VLKPRLIPCLDVSEGRVVKGIRFAGLRDAGDPVELAAAYADQGADELVVLDISATPAGRANATDVVRAVRAVLPIPLTVGGGVRSVCDAGRLLEAGADKVAVNSAAVERPELLAELAERFGSQCAILALDAARSSSSPKALWTVRTHSGARDTGRNAIEWAALAAERGAGEVLLTSFDRDGTRDGYDLELLRAIASAVQIPIIASGGADSAAHMAAALDAGAGAVLAASILHDGHTTIPDLKLKLADLGVETRS